MIKRKGSINLSDIEKKRDKEGRVICLNCDKHLPKGRQKYCSNECSYDWATKHNHQLMRGKFIKKYKGFCAKCGKQIINKKLRDDYPQLKDNEFIELFTSFESSIEVNNIFAIQINEAKLILDHKTPIAIGGAEFDEDNLQILCLKCNKIKTRKDHAEIAKARRLEKIMSNGQIQL